MSAPHHRSPRVAGLDSLRFVLALWVVFSHFGFVPVAPLERATDGPLLYARGVYHNLFCGPAAVIVFFLISGFCIHHQYRRDAIRSYATYYTRRYVRIVIPMVAAIALYLSRGLDLTEWHKTLLWSIVCEEIYYLVYPLLLALRKRIGWKCLLGLAYAGAAAVVATEPRALEYIAYGPRLTWILGLPCWLLGCLLAERHDDEGLPSARGIWTWRMAAWGLGSAASMLRFHGGIGYPLTLTLFAAFGYFWLAREIAWSRAHEPLRWLELAGTWSYSLYLMHPYAESLVGAGANWFAKLAIALAVSVGFYLTIERPSHRAAQALGRRLA
jgi:peptidoglycan/LPS O-acetylase OafA/YrhL